MLWRASLLKLDEYDKLFQEESKAYLDSGLQDLSVTNQRLEEITNSQERDSICQVTAWCCREDGLEQGRIHGEVKIYDPVFLEKLMGLQ